MKAGEEFEGNALYEPGVGERTAGEMLELDPSELAHVRALRLHEGDPVRITDGKGRLWAARLVRGSAGLSVRLEAPHPVSGPLPADLWVPVGNKQATLWLVEKAAEFGASGITPIEFARSASVADASRSPGFWRKAERRAVAAMKQSGGAWLPKFGSPRPLPTCLEDSPEEGSRFILDRSGVPLADRLAEWDGRQPVTVVVGPEGGLTAEEYDMCEAAGFTRVGLASRVLRFETAAVAALAVLAQRALQQEEV
ncbi:MAG: RsmE family RNA methyltransferase [Gemmatimonadota bacterium]